MSFIWYIRSVCFTLFSVCGNYVVFLVLLRCGQLVLVFWRKELFLGQIFTPLECVGNYFSQMDGILWNKILFILMIVHFFTNSVG